MARPGPPHRPGLSIAPFPLRNAPVTIAGMSAVSPIHLAEPREARVESCIRCQLDCPSCATVVNDKREFLGEGRLRLPDFESLLDHNPWIRKVELASNGEAFLNPELPEILACAHARGVDTGLGGGVNLNHASEEALLAVVEYGVRRIRVAIDGATNATYRIYRRGGALRAVIRNIEEINRHKRRLGSKRPQLVLQFIAFGHNEHEIEKARLLAEMLDMRFFLRLNRDPDYSPVEDPDRLLELSGYRNRSEYEEAERGHYCDEICTHLWKSPQINWDGKLVGCSLNHWRAFAEDAFRTDLRGAVNGEAMVYARRMLTGDAPPRDDIPCTHCHIFHRLARSGYWITAEKLARRGVTVGG